MPKPAPSEIPPPPGAPRLFDDPGRSPLALPMRVLLGEQYLVGRVLGKPGGFGITYLGWDVVLKRRVAIKEYFPRELVGRAEDGRCAVPHDDTDRGFFVFGLESFLQEARTLATVAHRGVVRVLHFFEQHATAYMVMEFHQGASLAEVLFRAGGRLPPERSLAIAIAILDALEATHRHGFLHCDVKPHNVYLTDGGHTILIDFGAARLAVGERAHLAARIITPGYAAYEMYRDKTHLGPWTDVYGAGATLFQMLTGHRPPPATDRRLKDTLDLGAWLPSGLGAASVPALGRALAVDPEGRFPSALACADALRRIGAETTGAAAPEPPSAASGAFRRRRHPPPASLSETWELDQRPGEAAALAGAPGGRRRAAIVYLLAVLAMIAAALAFELWQQPAEAPAPAAAESRDR